MPSFQRLLVLSVLALSLSVQSAPVGTVESRDLGLASRSSGHHHGHHKLTRPEGKGHKGHGGKGDEGKGGDRVDGGGHHHIEAREFDDDEDDTLESRSSKHHHGHHKLTRPEGKGHKGHGGKGDEGKGGDRVDGGGHHHSSREFDEDEDNTLEARAKKHQKAHHKSTKPKGHKSTKPKGHEAHGGHKGKGGSLIGGLLNDVGIHGSGHIGVEVREVSLADIDE